MDPSYNNSPSQGQSPIISSGSAPASPTPTPSATPAPIPQAPVSSGDIVLSSGKPKSKKPLIVTVVILFIIGLIACIALAVRQQPKNTETISAANSTEFFNKYINYLIYGKKDSAASVDLDEFIKEYDLYNPETVYAETANYSELKAMEELYLALIDTYNKSSLIEAEQYFYYYLSCRSSSISENECAINLGAEYDSLYESDTSSATINLRASAMEALLNTYYDIYNIDNTIESESI